MNTRRHFVMASTAGALWPAVSGAALTAPEGTGAAALPRRLGGLPAQAAFESLQGASFRMRAGGTLTLDRVTARASRQPIEQFTIVLRGSPSQQLDEGLYELHHPATGRFALHLMPSGRQGAARLYRADLSLLV